MSTVTVSGDRIYQARLAANMSRSDLAYEIRRLSKGRHRTEPSLIGRWETGQNTPSANLLPLIAKATGKSMDFFYTEEATSAEEEDESG